MFVVRGENVTPSAIEDVISLAAVEFVCQLVAGDHIVAGAANRVLNPGSVSDRDVVDHMGRIGKAAGRKIDFRAFVKRPWCEA